MITKNTTKSRETIPLRSKSCEQHNFSLAKPFFAWSRSTVYGTVNRKSFVDFL
jgi:hypothetical protein